MAEHSDFNIEIKKDIKFLHVVDDLEKYMTETAIRLDMEDEFVDAIVDYPALNVIGAIDDRDVYYPSKLRNPRTIELIGDVTGSADFDGSQNIQIDAEILNNSHTHIIENVDGLQDSLDYKSNVDHVHDYVPITTSITAGSGLIGGGALNSSRTIAMQTPKTCTLHTLNEFPSGGGHTHAITGVAPLEHVHEYVPLTRTITAGVGLTGGGILSTDLTLTLGTPTTCTASTTNSVTATSHTHEITGFAETSFSIIAGNGLTGGGSLSSSRTITLGTPGTCSNSSANSVTETSHTHAITFPILGYAFYENFAGHTLTANTSSYILVKTFTIPIPAAGVYLFGCGCNVVAWGLIATTSDCVKFTMDATMLIGSNTGTYSEEVCRDRWITGYTENEQNPIYEYEDVGAKVPALNGRMVYFSSPGEKLLKVYMKGQSDFEISNVCVGVIGASI